MPLGRGARKAAGTVASVAKLAGANPRTRSPTSNSVTAAPTSVTTPAHSAPSGTSAPGYMPKRQQHVAEIDPCGQHAEPNFVRPQRCRSDRTAARRRRGCPAAPVRRGAAGHPDFSPSSDTGIGRNGAAEEPTARCRAWQRVASHFRGALVTGPLPLARASHGSRSTTRTFRSGCSIAMTLASPHRPAARGA